MTTFRSLYVPKYFKTICYFAFVLLLSLTHLMIAWENVFENPLN